MKAFQYIMVRRDIADKYGFGVLACQVCHASVAALTSQISVDMSKSVSDLLSPETVSWVSGVFYKAVVEVRDLDHFNIIRERLDADGIVYHVIKESKINEITCLGTRPYDKGRLAPHFKDLPLLGAVMPE